MSAAAQLPELSPFNLLLVVLMLLQFPSIVTVLTTKFHIKIIIK